MVWPAAPIEMSHPHKRMNQRQKNTHHLVRRQLAAKCAAKIASESLNGASAAHFRPARGNARARNTCYSVHWSSQWNDPFSILRGRPPNQIYLAEAIIIVSVGRQDEPAQSGATSGAAQWGPAARKPMMCSRQCAPFGPARAGRLCDALLTIRSATASLRPRKSRANDRNNGMGRTHTHTPAPASGHAHSQRRPAAAAS